MNTTKTNKNYKLFTKKNRQGSIKGKYMSITTHKAPKRG